MVDLDRTEHPERPLCGDPPPPLKEYKQYAFTNRTGACKERVDILAEFASRGHGLITVPTAQTVLRIASAPLASRALGTFVRVGQMRRVRIYGSTSYAWGTTARFARGYYNIKPGARFFPGANDLWRPHPEFVHDELTLRIMCGLVDPCDFLTEQEATRELSGKTRPPDGVVRLHIGHMVWVARVETVKSHQSGKAGGCAKIAKEIEAIALNQAEGRWQTSLGEWNATILIGSFDDGLRIARRIRKSLQRFDDPPRIGFLFVNLVKSDGEPFAEYKELDVFARVGPLQIWRVENDSPDITPVAPIWTPWL